MTPQTTSPRRRKPLSRERVLRAAIALADRHGVESLTMRRLGGKLGVEAMALYKHVANKDEILDGIVELVVGEIEIPTPGSEWRTAMRQRAISVRRVLRRHPWAIGLMESRGTPGPTTLRYLDAVLATLRDGGFSVQMAAHAFWLLDSYVYGHVIQDISLSIGTQDISLSIGTSERTAPAAEQMLEQAEIGDYPHLAEVAAEAMALGYDVDREFEFGLDLVLDALDGIRHRRDP
jgi:AcrR family transcriptional regulator